MAGIAKIKKRGNPNMEMRSILPLLMQQNPNDTRMQTLLSLAENKQPDLATVMQLAKSQTKPKGLRPIIHIAPYAILGKLVAWAAEE